MSSALVRSVEIELKGMGWPTQQSLFLQDNSPLIFEQVSRKTLAKRRGPESVDVPSSQS
jgi:hypothetical protein